jgi:hypothetical protein
MTYAELVAAVSAYCENTFETVDMDTMIRQTEQRIYNSVQLANLRKNVVGNTTASNPYLSCPDDLLSVYSLALVAPATGVYTYLLNKDVNFIRECYTVPSTTATPKYYALFGPRSDNVNELAFVLGPTPDATYVAELHYYYYPESIVDIASHTTWLGDNFDSALLNGVMVEAITYMKGEADLVKLYQDRYVQSITLLKNLGDGKQRMDAYRSGQVRTTVS